MVVIQLIFIEITGTALLWLKIFFELRPVFENYGDRRLCVIILYNLTRQIWRRWGNTTRLYLLFDVSTSITEEAGTSPFSSWQDENMPCQESSHMRDWVDGCPHPDLWLVIIIIKSRWYSNMRSFCSASKESWGSEGAAGASTRTRTTISGWKSNTGCCMCSIFLSLRDISGAWKHVSVCQSNVGRW